MGGWVGEWAMSVLVPHATSVRFSCQKWALYFNYSCACTTEVVASIRMVVLLSGFALDFLCEVTIDTSTNFRFFSRMFR